MATQHLKKQKLLHFILKALNTRRIYYSLTFIVLLFFFTIISFIGYLTEKKYLIFISIFILIFITNFWLFLLTFSFTQRTQILWFIHMRNRILQNTDLIGAEIGVYQGDYSEEIFNYFKKKCNLKFYLIDQWIINDNFKDRPTPFVGYSSEELELAYKQVKNRFINKKGVEIMKMDSLSASQKFSDNYFDFVYLDANHDYDFILSDLKAWFPKVKNQGILFGDDYNRPYGVNKAVAEFAYENKLIVHFTDNQSQFYLIKSE